jgi:glucuronoarabinoxylan endo-1,4-beta-xylanase
MSVQNEPDYAWCVAEAPCNYIYPTMLYTPDEMVAFIKVVGPRLHAGSPHLKVIAPEPAEWLHLWTNNSAPGSTNPLNGEYDYGHVLANDADAWAQIDVVGTHQYDTQVAESWPSDVSHTKPVWMTEMSGVKGWPEGGPSGSIENGVAVAGWIHSALVVGDASAWLWLALYVDYSEDNQGLVLAHGMSPTKRYYVLGNYSKFVRPGYVRVEINENSNADLLVSAYKSDKGGTIVVGAVNQGTSSATVPIALDGGTTPTTMTPYVTSAVDSLKAGPAVTVSDGVFSATLAATNVTTLVGQ